MAQLLGAFDPSLAAYLSQTGLDANRNETTLGRQGLILTEPRFF